MERPGELELRRYLRSQRQLASRLLEGESLDEIAGDFLFTVAHLLRWDAGALWEAGEGEPILRFVSGWSVADLDAEPLWRHSRELVVERGKGLPGRAWEEGEIAWAPDFARSPLYPRGATAAELGLSAALAIPLPVGHPEGVLGVAEFHARSFSPPSEELLALLGAFSDQLATFIARRRERARAERAQSHLAQVVAGTQDAVFSKGLDGVIATWNPAAERLYGYSAEEAIGQHVAFLMPDSLKHEEREILDRVRRGERLETYETHRVRKDGTGIDVSLTVSRIEDPVLGVVGASVVARDITDEVRRRRAQSFLAGASRDFDSSLDPAETARNIVHSAIPDLAEVCVIDFVRRDGSLGDSVAAAGQPRVAAALEQIRQRSPLDPASDHPAALVLREDRAMIWHDLKAPEVVDQVVQSPEHRKLMEEAGYNSAAVVPLRARGSNLGTLSFLHARANLRYDATDLEFLAELGGRAALALDNARLFRERDSIARDLQRGLRPPRPARGPGPRVLGRLRGRRRRDRDRRRHLRRAADRRRLLGPDRRRRRQGRRRGQRLGRHAPRGARADPRGRGARGGAEPGQRAAARGQRAERLRDGLAGPHARRRGRRLDGLAGERRAPAGGPSRREGRGAVRRRLGAGRLGGGAAARHETTIGPGETLVLSTDGWHEAGPVEAHRDAEGMAEIALEFAGAELGELTAALREDALSRGGGALRDDIVVLAVRPTGEDQSSATRSRTGVPSSDER